MYVLHIASEERPVSEIYSFFLVPVMSLGVIKLDGGRDRSDCPTPA